MSVDSPPEIGLTTPQKSNQSSLSSPIPHHPIHITASPSVESTSLSSSAAVSPALGFGDFSLLHSSQSSYNSPALSHSTNSDHTRNRKESVTASPTAEIFLVPASASAFNSSATALGKFAASPAHQSQNLQHNFQHHNSNHNHVVNSPATPAAVSSQDSLSNLFSPLISLFKPNSTTDSNSSDHEADDHQQLKRDWNEILANWRPDMKTSRRVQSLVWKGIPPSMREEAWQKIISNDLNITKDLYRIFQLRADEAREKEMKNRDAGEYLKSDSALAIIDKDIPRTFPELKFFHDEGLQLQQNLRNILSTYSLYRPDTGYVQGMSYLAAMCLLNMEEFPAFVCLANVLNSPLHFKFFTMSVSDMTAHLSVYQHYLKVHLPTVYANFEHQNIRPDMYLFDWLMTIFTRSLPLEVAFRVWDNFLVLGHAFLFRTALGIVKIHSTQLEIEPFERCLEILLRPKSPIPEDKLFANIAKIDIQTVKMDKLIQEKMKNFHEKRNSGNSGDRDNSILGAIQ